MQRRSESLTCAFICLWLAAIVITLALFHIFDWMHELVRTGLLLLIAALAWGYRRELRQLAPITRPPERWTRSVVRMARTGAAINTAIGLVVVLVGFRSASVPSDQAQSVIEALGLLRHGINPWASTTILDHVAYPLAVDELDAIPECQAASGDALPPTNAEHQILSGRSNATAALPHLRALPECARLRHLFSALGFKYGPVMLLFYWPFVTLLGPAGFPIAHLLLFAACCLLVARWAGRGHDPFKTATALIPLVWSTQLTWNALIQGHLDLLPVFLACCCLVLCEQRQFGTAAVCLGVSIGAKLLPGLLFVPLLLKAPRRFLAVAALTVLAAFGPVAIWDWSGLWHNFAYPFLRGPDSTALAFLLGPQARLAASAGSLLVAGWLAVRAHVRRWDLTGSLNWLMGAHLLTLGSGSTFHNNYLVWLLPILSAWVINGKGSVAPARMPAAVATESSAPERRPGVRYP